MHILGRLYNLCASLPSRFNRGFFPPGQADHDIFCRQECVLAGIPYWHYGGIVEVAWFEYHSHRGHRGTGTEGSVRRCGETSIEREPTLADISSDERGTGRLSRREKRNVIDWSIQTVSRCSSSRSGLTVLYRIYGTRAHDQTLRRSKSKVFSPWGCNVVLSLLPVCLSYRPLAVTFTGSSGSPLPHGLQPFNPFHLIPPVISSMFENRII